MPDLVEWSAARGLRVSKFSNGSAHPGDVPLVISARTAPIDKDRKTDRQLDMDFSKNCTSGPAESPQSPITSCCIWRYASRKSFDAFAIEPALPSNEICFLGSERPGDRLACGRDGQ